MRSTVKQSDDTKRDLLKQMQDKDIVLQQTASELATVKNDAQRLAVSNQRIPGLEE